MTRTDAVVVDCVSKSFGDVHALRDISFRAEAGTVLGILGPNGAGKTTTVDILSTLLVADSGRATVAGYDVADDPDAVRRVIATTGQYSAIDYSLTGRENLQFFGRLMGLSRRTARLRADELLERFDLAAAADRQARTYSGGMVRRLDIACSLVVEPSVVFLDEPTTGLDPRSRKYVWSLVEQLGSLGITTLLTTQYLEEADVLSDRIVVIDHGSVVAEGTAHELKATVGERRCEIVPRDTCDLARLADEFADLDATVPAHDANALTVVAADGVDTVGTVIDRARRAGIELEDVSLRRPSLDDVFLALTGSRGGEGEEQ
ncbi:ATP-binding cassette domain-containing protein [Rhodococcus sp. Z13]|uniref:ATP-binding cassette domain-containing protein n=1 Tax=Rhodococcus sacchari TaxID=2962047 RepID=A0ACD4DI46_9NOCA|nr:ATP-binding cassette domain-containing protein [Rhodococcus sp. Z13]UYP19740.1 ATP-binding cassette domain-containing protein [Rhodococcus sp. Z13]